MNRIRQRALARVEARQQKKQESTPSLIEEDVKEEEDASELEYQEKKTRQRRTKKQKLEVDEPSKPKRKYTRRKKDEN